MSETAVELIQITAPVEGLRIELRGAPGRSDSNVEIPASTPKPITNESNPAEHATSQPVPNGARMSRHRSSSKENPSRSPVISTEVLPEASASANDQAGENFGQQVIDLEVTEGPLEEFDEYPTGFKLAVTVIATCLALVVVGFDNSILSTAVPSITDEFKTIADVAWYYSAYRLCSCAFQFMFGKLYTLYSLKTVFLVALAIFEAGSLLAGLAPNSKLFILGRAIAGFGGAGILAGAFVMMRHSVPLHRRPILTSTAAAVEGISEAVAPVLGGLITDHLSWRWCFLVNLPIGAVTFVSMAIFFRDPHVNTDASLPLIAKLNKIDLLGTGIFVLAIAALLMALQWGGTKYGWGSACIIFLFCVFGVLMSIFIRYQWRRKDNAALPFRVIGNRSILSAMIFAMCNSSAVNVILYYMPIYFQTIKETTASQSGVMTLPMVISQSLGIILGGPSISFIGYYVPVMLLTSLITPIASGLFTTLDVNASLAKLIVYQALLGLGSGIGWQGPQIAAQTIRNKDDAAMGIACIVFAQHFGPAIFVSVAQAIFIERLTSDLESLAPELFPHQGGNNTSLASMGLSDLKKQLGPKNLEDALLGYDKAITQTFYLPLALTCMTVIGSVAVEWRSVKKKQS